jgi:hypothetical protein
MISQVVAISLTLLSIHWPALTSVAVACMWGVVLFAVASAADYFRKFWHKVDSSIKLRRRRELIDLERRQKLQARAERKLERAAGLASRAKESGKYPA